jgi:hypothetical protein
LDYTENSFLQNISHNVLDLYEFLLIKRLSNLQEINSKALDVGHVKYLTVKFEHFLVGGRLVQGRFAWFMNVYLMIAREYQFVAALQNTKSILQKNKLMIPFTQTMRFFEHKNKASALHYLALFEQQQA